MDTSQIIMLSLWLRMKPGHPPLPDDEYWAKTSFKERKYLTRGEFADIYGADEEDLKALEKFAALHNLKVVEKSASKRTVVVSGTAVQFNEIFKAGITYYETGGKRYHANTNEIHLPNELSAIVTHIFGMDNRPVSTRLSSPGTTAPLTPAQVAALYNFPANSAEGQTIGVLEFAGGYRIDDQGKPTDIDSFFNGQGLIASKVVPVLKDGAINDQNAESTGGISWIVELNASYEIALDIDVAASVAQQATIVVYFGANNSFGWQDLIWAAINDEVNNPSILSISWGGAEDVSWAPRDLGAISLLFQQASLMGITVLAASGDAGANSGVHDGLPHVEYPASDHWVTACGGTVISNVNDGHFSENTWNNRENAGEIGLVGGATGGGISKIFSRPYWQITEGSAIDEFLVNPFTMRGVPDIAGNASPASGYNIIAQDGVATIGGTSAVAPLYAGLVAVMNARLGYRLGFINPYLYQAKLANPLALRDIADGISNGLLCYKEINGPQPPYDIVFCPGFESVNGWDACTGLGVINGMEFLRFFLPHIPIGQVERIPPFLPLIGDLEGDVEKVIKEIIE